MKTKDKLKITKILRGLLIFLNIFMIFFFAKSIINVAILVDETSHSIDKIYNYIYSSNFGLSINWLFLFFLVISILVNLFLYFYNEER